MATVAAAGKAMGWPVAEATVQEAVADAEKWATRERGAVCIAGSLFLVGEVLARTSPITTRTDEWLYPIYSPEGSPGSSSWRDRLAFR